MYKCPSGWTASHITSTSLDITCQRFTETPTCRALRLWLCLIELTFDLYWDACVPQELLLGGSPPPLLPAP